MSNDDMQDDLTIRQFRGDNVWRDDAGVIWLRQGDHINIVTLNQEQAWNDGWDAGNEYAISEPWDPTCRKVNNPYLLARTSHSKDTE